MQAVQAQFLRIPSPIIPPPINPSPINPAPINPAPVKQEQVTEEREVVCKLIDLVSDIHIKILEVGHTWGANKSVPCNPSSNFFCPITLHALRQPCVMSDGWTYEAATISRWVESSDISPLTHTTLSSKSMFTNRALCSIMDVWPEENLFVLINGCNISFECRTRTEKLQATFDYITSIIRNPDNLMYMSNMP